MLVHTRAGNDKERKENKFVIIETESKVYNLDCKNGFVLISLLKDAEDFKPFDDMCKDFKSNDDLEAYLKSHNIKF